MIPKNYLLEWADRAPWPEEEQVEQDLIVSRALVEIFSDTALNEKLAFRGGTALNKLHFPAPFRYSEDIDLVQVAPEPIGPALHVIRDGLYGWLGRANHELKENAAKLRYRFTTETGIVRKLKIEINTREHGAFLDYEHRDFSLDNSWFKGDASIRTFQVEEILATKLRALLQRDKGRDLFDLMQAMNTYPDLDRSVVVDTFQKYLERTGTTITRAMAEHRVLSKLETGRALSDMRPLVPHTDAHLVSKEAASIAAAHILVCLIEKLPGNAHEQTDARIEQLGLRPYMNDAIAYCDAKTSSTTATLG